MKSLILADLHANLAALQAVLHHEQRWDEILFLGDAVLGGPQPDEVLTLLRTLPGVFLMGNHDREILEQTYDPHHPKPDKRWALWTQQQLSEPNRRFLAGFIPSCTLQRHGLTLRLHHGDFPNDLGGRIWPDSAPAVFDSLCQLFPEPIVLLAHSHIQFQHRHHNTLFLNPGSVGQPRLAQPLACYAAIEDGRIDLRAVPYDAEATAAAMDRVDIGDPRFIEEWKTCYRTGVLPNRYKIRDFLPLRARYR